MADDVVIRISAKELITDAFNRTEKRVGGLSEKLTAFSTTAKSVGLGMTKYVTAPILGVGAGILKLGIDYDNALKSMSTSTGATGVALDGLGATFQEVFGAVPDEAATVAAAIGDIHTITGATGPVLQEMTQRVLEASRLLGEDATENAQGFSRALAQFQIPAKDGAAVMDRLFKIGQDTTAGFGELIRSTNTYGSVLSNAGFSMEESALLFGNLTKSGIDVSRVMPGLNTAFRNWAAEGRNTQDMLQQTIERMRTAKTDTEALTIATKTFGAEGAQRMTTAVRNGSFALDDLTSSLQGSEGTIASTAEANKTLKDQFVELWHAIQKDLMPVGRDLVQTLIDMKPTFVSLADRVSGLVRWFAELSPSVQTVILGLGGLVAAAGPVLFVLGTMATGISSLLPLFAPLKIAILGVGSAAPGAATGVGLLGGSLRALTLAAGPVGIAITGMWAAWKVFQWAKARNEVASVDARIASLSERIANISDTGARATRMKQHLTAALRDEEAALTAANAAAAAAVRNAPAEIARLEAEIEALPTLSRNYGNVVRAKEREIAENRQLLADREEQVTAIREETAAIEASQQAIWDAAVALMRATKTNDDFAASVEGSTAAVDALDTSVDRFTGGTSNSRNALMGFIGTLQPLPQLGIEAAMAVDALDTSFDRFTGGTSNSRNALMGFIGNLQDLPAAATPSGTAAADGFLSGMDETFAKAFAGGGGFLGGLQATITQGWGTLFLDEGETAATGFIGRMQGIFSTLGGVPLVGPLLQTFGPALISGIGQLAGTVWGGIKSLFGGPAGAELEGRRVAGTFRQGLLAELNPEQMAEVQQAMQGAWKGNEIGAATVIAIRDAYIAAGASAEDALDVVNRLWQAEQQGGAAVQEVIDEITQTIATEVTPTVEASGEAFEEVAEVGRGTFAGLTTTIDRMQAKIANTDSLDRMAAEFRKASDGSTYDLGTILREAESLTDSLGSTHPAVVQMQGLIRDASETGVWDFGQMALAIGAIKDEMATPIVIPVTPVLTGMIDPDREGNDRLSPSNFRTREAWEANWLARNPGDAHRADEALGGHQFAAGTGGLRQFSPFGTPAWLHGEEEVLTRRQGEGVASMVSRALQDMPRASVSIAGAGDADAARLVEALGRKIDRLITALAGRQVPVTMTLNGTRLAEELVPLLPGILKRRGFAI